LTPVKRYGRVTTLLMSMRYFIFASSKFGMNCNLCSLQSIKSSISTNLKLFSCAT
jgi:hypothetical protein